MPAKYRKITEPFEAMQWDGENATAVVDWAQGGWRSSNSTEAAKGSMWLKQKLFPDSDIAVWRLVVPTSMGDKDAAPRDWIVKSGDGTLAVVSEEAFGRLYEPSP